MGYKIICFNLCNLWQNFSMYDLQDFLQPINKAALNNDEGYNEGQLGNHISIFENNIPDLENAKIILVGVNEVRGAGQANNQFAADAVRKQLYRLHYWHTNILIADIGNIKIGATLQDTYAALKTVVAELLKLNKKVIILGGSHDVTLAQYFAYKQLEKVVEATCIDATIDLKNESHLRSDNFLLEMLTDEPNLVRHYNHIGFQSYFVHPGLLETIDKLRFDCFRVGTVKENLEEIEPAIRNSHFISFDISAIKNSDAPANSQSPNGFTGEEACVLTQYAGLSSNASSLGIYGYNPAKDVHELTAVQIAQMIWYYVDGVNKSMQEAILEDRNLFNEFHCTFTEVETVFLQSKKTRRWWMQLPNKKFIACSHNDYIQASHNDIPERWLRAQERG
jgi:formiminoglutamase